MKMAEKLVADGRNELSDKNIILCITVLVIVTTNFLTGFEQLVAT